MARLLEGAQVIHADAVRHGITPAAGWLIKRRDYCQPGELSGVC